MENYLLKVRRVFLHLHITCITTTGVWQGVHLQPF